MSCWQGFGEDSVVEVEADSIDFEDKPGRLVSRWENTTNVSSLVKPIQSIWKKGHLPQLEVYRTFALFSDEKLHISVSLTE